jgi:hypothetical protein
VADPSRPPTGSEPDAPTPRWVYATGIVIIVLALAFVAMHLAGGGIPTH